MPTAMKPRRRPVDHHKETAECDQRGQPAANVRRLFAGDLQQESDAQRTDPHPAERRRLDEHQGAVRIGAGIQEHLTSRPERPAAQQEHRIAAGAIVRTTAEDDRRQD